MISKKEITVIALGSILLYGALAYSFYYSNQMVQEHFLQGGLVKCSGRVDNLVISNERYIYRDDHFINGEIVFSVSSCSRIK